MAEELWVAHIPLPVPYLEGVAIQERIRDARQAGELPDVLLLLEHESVYTRGRRTGEGELPMGEDWYRSQGIEVCDADRGGAVTYHGPGQLVGYPIMEIGNVREYVAGLERGLIAALADEGIHAEIRDGLTGVWSPKGKIGSIGVHVSRRVSTHGFAVNVDNDLQPFEWVVPCGMQGAQMSSLCKETGRAGRMECFRREVAHRLAEEYGRRQRLVSLDRLLAAERPRVVSMSG